MNDAVDSRLIQANRTEMIWLIQANWTKKYIQNSTYGDRRDKVNLEIPKTTIVVSTRFIEE